jgi:flagellar basal-body rod modification protein FlgD
MTVSNVDNVYSYLNSQYSSIGKETAEAESNDSGQLAMSDFLSLMTTQLMNQDPLSPMESGDFLGQIASFSTVSGISDLQNSFSSFAKAMQSDQALQGSSLVGRSVLIPSSIGMLDENGMRGQINVAEPVTDLKLTIYDENGSIVRTINMGEASGYTSFEWDGLDDSGEALPAGGYQFIATGTASGANTAFGTAVIAKVDSVLVGSGDGLTVNLAGIGSVPFSEVQEII